MEGKGRHLDITKLSLAGVIVTLGIVFGELGTSPLYVMKAILKGSTEFNELLDLWFFIPDLLDTYSPDNNKVYTYNPQGR